MEQWENWYGFKKLASLRSVGDFAMMYWSSDEQPFFCPSWYAPRLCRNTIIGLYSHSTRPIQDPIVHKARQASAHGPAIPRGVNVNFNKDGRLRERPYIHTCWGARASIADRRQSPPLTASAPSMEGAGTIPAAPRADSLHFGLLGSKVSQNGRFPAQDAPEAPCKIWRR